MHNSVSLVSSVASWRVVGTSGKVETKLDSLRLNPNQNSKKEGDCRLWGGTDWGCLAVKSQCPPPRWAQSADGPVPPTISPREPSQKWRKEITHQCQQRSSSLFSYCSNNNNKKNPNTSSTPVPKRRQTLIASLNYCESLSRAQQQPVATAVMRCPKHFLQCLCPQLFFSWALDLVSSDPDWSPDGFEIYCCCFFSFFSCFRRCSNVCVTARNLLTLLLPIDFVRQRSACAWLARTLPRMIYWLLQREVNG